MGDKSKIEWTDATWNPIVGCSIVSPGCTNCYAMGMAARINKMTLSSHYEGLTRTVNGKQVWTGNIAQAPDHILTAPLRWKRPRRVFVNSMGDLFHESIPDEWIDRVFAMMALAPQHTFQVLTKRAARMRDYLATWPMRSDEPDRIAEIACEIAHQFRRGHQGNAGVCERPLPNVWLGISAERQQEADERIPLLIETPAAVRFVSLEPLLGPIDLNHLHEEFDAGLGHSWESCLNSKRFNPWADGDLDGYPKLDWVIVGGESGPHARPMHPDWARSLRDQCAAAGVPFFFKQWGAHRSLDISSNPEPNLHFERVGKKAAGRLLDGRTHDEFPQAGIAI